MHDGEVPYIQNGEELTLETLALKFTTYSDQPLLSTLFVISNFVYSSTPRQQLHHAFFKNYLPCQQWPEVSVEMGLSSTELRWAVVVPVLSDGGVWGHWYSCRERVVIDRAGLLNIMIPLASATPKRISFWKWRKDMKVSINLGQISRTAWHHNKLNPFKKLVLIFVIRQPSELRNSLKLYLSPHRRTNVWVLKRFHSRYTTMTQMK